MASVYTNDLRLEEIGTGEQSGTWGTTTNTNLELIAEAFSYGAEVMADANITLTIADGTSDELRSFYIKITSSTNLTATRTVTLAPNDLSKVWMIENATGGSQIITIKQGTGATVNIANGQVKMVATDGGEADAIVYDLLTDVELAGTTTATALTVDDVAIDGKVITMTGSSGDTATMTVGTNGTLAVTTTDGSAAAANITITADGTFEAAGTTVTLNSSGGITLDADGGTITFADAGSSLGTITSSGYSGTAAVATTVTITDNESTNEDNAIIFTAGGDVDGGNIGLESDGTLTYNPSTGTVTATGFSGNLTGTLQTAAQANVTSLGTLTTLTVDNVVIDGAVIGHTSDTDLITLSSGVVTVAGELDAVTGDFSSNVDIAGDLTLSAGADGALRFSAASSVKMLDNNAAALVFEEADTAYMTFVTTNSSEEVQFDVDVDLNGALDVSGEITATGFTGTLDGILGSGSAAAATVTTLDTSGAVNLNLTTDSTSSTSGALIVDGGVGVAKKLFVGTDLTVGGDLTISGDDLIMGTNTAGMLLIADGTNFNPTLATSLTEISTAANDDVFIAVDTSGGGLKKITRSTILAGTGSSDDLANVVEDTTPQLGGNLDMNGADIVTTSNATLDLAPNGTGTVVVRGNTNSGAIVFNCESNSHGQKVFGQPHSAGVTNTLMLPAGANSTLVSLVSTDTLTNKTLTSPKINEDVAVTSTATELNVLDGITAVVGELNALDIGSTAVGTAVASKAVILDSDKDYTGIRNFTITGNLSVGGTTTVVDTVTMEAANAVVFEGATADAHETTLTIIDPTADRTINLPNQSGTIPVLAAASNTAVTSTPEELNILDGVTSTAAELNILDGVTATAAEINLIDGGTARGTTAVADGDGFLTNDGGTMRMTKVDTLATYMSGKIVGGSAIVTTGALNSGTITSGFGNIDTGSSTITTTGLISGGSLDIDNVLINGTTIGHTDDTDLITLADGLVTVAGEVQMTTLDIGGTNVTSTAAELNVLDGITAVVGELNALDIGSTAVGTAVASKAVILDSNKDYTGMRNLTVSGELDAATGDFSGAVDVAGAFTNGSTLVSTGKITADAGIDIDNFNIDGTTIALSSGDMTLDGAADIVLDAAGGDVFVKAAGTTFGSLTNTSGNLIIKSGTTTAATFAGANVTLAGTVASGAITSSGNVTAFSDERLKSNIVTVSDALSKVESMRGVHYTRKDTGKDNTGVIAQEIQKIAPEVVLESEDKMKTLSVDYGNITGYLIEAVKELSAKVKELEGRLDDSTK